ncbi:MAG: YbaB/EbfC family nucleoid-associated protein [Clostridia bacterium]|nr:YbaB/EbfC family nucleoid-associated protein [Clostridia bacterium]
MKARLPQGYGGGPGNMQSMLKQAQKMQEDMQTAQAELEAKEYTASSGGNMVEATVNGKHEVIGLKINPDVVDPDDVEMLEDLVLAAVNEAIRAAASDSEQTMGAITGGLNLPGMF